MTSSSTDQTGGGVGEQQEPLDEDQDFYEGFEGDDDLFDRSSGSRKKKSAKKQRASDTPSTEDSDDDASLAKPDKVTYATLPRGVKIGIVLALIVGVITGIYVAGGSGNSGTLADAELPEGHPDISQMGSSDASVMGTGEVEGLAELVALVQREPENLDARIDLGVVYFNAGEIEEAGNQWQAVLEADPDNVPALYSMGFYYLSLDPPNEAGARETWSRVVELDPDSEEAANATSHLQSLIGTD